MDAPMIVGGRRRSVSLMHATTHGKRSSSSHPGSLPNSRGTTLSSSSLARFSAPGLRSMNKTNVSIVAAVVSEPASSIDPAVYASSLSRIQPDVEVSDPAGPEAEAEEGGRTEETPRPGRSSSPASARARR